MIILIKNVNEIRLTTGRGEGEERGEEEEEVLHVGAEEATE